MFNKVILAFFTVVTLSACGEKSSPDGSPQTASDLITIQDAYIRAMPPGQKVTAMFLTLNNASSDSHKLVQAGSDISEYVELHEHKHVDGMMQMGRVEDIAIPENGTVSLKPGGYHIMMINLKQNLELGQKVDVKLSFEDNSSKTIQVEVKSIIPAK